MYKALQIAEYLIELANSEDDGSITNLKLQKLLYYTQGFCLALFDKPLFPEEIEAWQYGPVVPSIYEQYQDFGRNPLTNKQESDFKPDQETYELIKEVYRVYGQYTSPVLVKLTHQESPWQNTNPREVITHKLMRDYFNSQLVEN